MTDSIKTICPYCGVGCGLLIEKGPDDEISVKGDPDHPANYGRLCSKGAALGQTMGPEGRLLYPKINGQRAGWSDAIQHVADGFAKIIKQHGPDSVAFYVSGQLLTEDYYVANKLMKGFIGSANIDTNSRLCMSSTVAGQKRAFGSDTVPCCYEDLEQAKLIVLTGSNAAWCHPVLYQRIVSAKKQNSDLKVVVIDPRRTATCDIADLHLPVASGSDAVLFNGLLNYMHENGYVNELYLQQYTEGFNEALKSAQNTAGDLENIANQCGLDKDALEEFYRWFVDTERVVTVYSQGVNQSSSGTDKVNAIINCHLATGRIGRPGMGPFSFTGQTNAMGGREVGGLANQLAAHMDIENKEHREIVQKHWGSPLIADRQGLKAVELFQSIESGKVKAIWIICTNPVVSLPEADQVKKALEKCELVVVSECIENTDTTPYADVVLPAKTWSEKDGTVTNSERCISRQRGFVSGVGESRPDWWIISSVAKAMNFSDAFDYSSPVQIFKEHAALSGVNNGGSRDFDISGLSLISDGQYDDLQPTQWPITSERPDGQQRMFASGRFYTDTGKAQFIAVSPRKPVQPVTDSFPFVLNTGRSRDQWHTMARTGFAARLSEHAPEPYLEMHPNDAQTIGVGEGSLVSVFSQLGEAVARLRVDHGQCQGSVFMPIHWNDQFTSLGRVGAVVNAEVDPVSGQPEFKHTPVKVVPYRPEWHGFLLSRRKLELREASYWSRAIGDGFYRYEIAGEQSADDWPAWARNLLCASEADTNWVEYLDKGSKQYRGVRLVSNRVESCIFIAPDHQLPPRSWLEGLFAKQSLNDVERKGLLTGRAPVGQKDQGRVICACFQVGINTIMDAIRTQGLTTPEAIGDALKAGTNCGSCVPEIRELLGTTLSQKTS